MKSEYFLILICVFIPVIHFLILYLIKFLPKSYYEIKNRFKISIYIIWILFSSSLIFLKIQDYIFILSTSLLIISLNFFVYTFWSLITHGFTINLLFNLPHNRKKISLVSWIKKYTHGNNLSFFTEDRIPILTKTKFAKRSGNKLSITKLGVLVNIILSMLRSLMFLK